MAGLTLAEIRAKVADLKAHAGGDPEADHAARDGILLGALRSIAGSAPDAPIIAAEALAVEDIELTLWYV